MNIYVYIHISIYLSSHLPFGCWDSPDQFPVTRERGDLPPVAGRGRRAWNLVPSACVAQGDGTVLPGHGANVGVEAPWTSRI